MALMGKNLKGVDGFPDGTSGKERACRCWGHRGKGWVPGWEDALEEGVQAR